MNESLALLITLIIALGIAAQWLSWWMKLPSILLLLIIGIVAGPVTGVLNPDEVFGELLFPMISMGVALVLFEGALTLRFSDIKGHGPSVTNMVTWGAGLSWLIIAAGTYFFTNMNWVVSLLFGSLVVVTGPTVITPLLRTVRPTPNVSNILRWEGILIDPLGALLAVIVFEAITSGAQGNSLVTFLVEIATGLTAGIAAAVSLGFLLRRHLLPEYLQNVFALALALTTFAVANHYADESGLLAVTVMGLWLANDKKIDIHEILSFKESLSVLIISVLFIVLAARFQVSDLLAAGWSSIGVLATVLIARPIMVFASTWRSELSVQEKSLIAWIGPRGIVAAAVSSLFALKLENQGYEQAHLLSALTFMVIIVTVLLQSLTAKPLARALGVTEEEPRGILIIGANAVARAVATALQENGFRIKVTGTSWSDIKSARMEGLDTFFGSPVSAHADQQLDLVGIGRLFAMSRRPGLNTLSCLKYRNEFGRNRVFSLRTTEEKDDFEKSRINDQYRAPRLFDDSLTLQKLASLLAQGGEVKTTRFTESFTWDHYITRYGKSVIPLFLISAEGKLRAFTNDFEPDISSGSKVIALLPVTAIEHYEQSIEGSGANSDNHQQPATEA